MKAPNVVRRRLQGRAKFRRRAVPSRFHGLILHAHGLDGNAVKFRREFPKRLITALFHIRENSGHHLRDAGAGSDGRALQDLIAFRFRERRPIHGFGKREFGLFHVGHHYFSVKSKKLNG